LDKVTFVDFFCCQPLGNLPSANTPLHAMPQDYQTRLPQFDAIGPLSAQQHIDKMNDYFDLHEVDEADVQMRLFAQSLTGDVKK
jgi:hypothetical protein